MCKECFQAKRHKNSFSKPAGSNSKVTLEVIYSNVCGPTQMDSIGGDKYCVTFMDDYSRKLWTYLIKKKGYVIEVFTKSMMERKICHKIKILRSVGGGEYMSDYFDALCERKRIVHELVPPYSPQ